MLTLERFAVGNLEDDPPSVAGVVGVGTTEAMAKMGVEAVESLGRSADILAD
jgi:hypothetical protein